MAWALHLGRRDGKRLDEERRGAKRDREEAAHDRELFRQHQAAEAQKRRLASKVSLVVEAFRGEAGGSFGGRFTMGATNRSLWFL